MWSMKFFLPKVLLPSKSFFWRVVATTSLALAFSGCLKDTETGSQRVTGVLAIMTPSNRAQYSGSFALTGTCSSDASSVVSISYGNSSLSGTTEASCINNAFSATLTTDRTVSLGQVTVAQADGSKSLNIAGMTEYISLPHSLNSFKEIGSNYVNDVHVVGTGATAQVFAATSQGLSISNDGGATFTTKTTANGLGSNTVYDVYVVGTGATAQVFAATEGGLSISNDGGATFTTKTTANGLGHNWVHDVYVVGSGSSAQVFAATWAGGLSISAGGLSISNDGGASFTTKSTANGLGDNWVYGVYVVGSGATAQVFAGTYGGLSISNDGGATFTTKTTANGLGSNTVYDVHVVGSGATAQVFAATYGGGLSTRMP